MKKEIVQYAKSKFMHFDGKEREFTVCMVSISPDNYNDLAYELDDKEHPNYLFTNDPSLAIQSYEEQKERYDLKNNN